MPFLVEEVRRSHVLALCMRDSTELSFKPFGFKATQYGVPGLGIFGMVAMVPEFHV